MIRKLLLFVSINAAIAVGAAFAPISMVAGGEYERQRVVYEFIDALEPGQRLKVILGDSRSECCIDAGAMGFVNLSLAGATPVEGYHQLQRILDRGAQVEELILSYGPFHVFGQDTYHSRTLYFGFVPEDFVRRVDAEAVELGDLEYQQSAWQALDVVNEYLPFASNDVKFAVLNVLSLDRTFTALFDNGLARVFGSANAEREIADPRYKLSELTTTQRVNEDDASPEFLEPDAESPVNELYLGRIVELAQAHRIDVAYLVMPFNDGIRQPDEGYFERFDRVLAETGLAECFGGIDFWPNDFFFDASHVNEAGARRLGTHIRQKLRYCDW